MSGHGGHNIVAWRPWMPQESEVSLMPELLDPPSTPTVAQATPALSVLVVEDSRTQQQIIGKIVRGCGGYAPLFAENGHEALRLIKHAKPTVVLTDIFMPKMGGLELVEYVREEYPGIPVVLMTAKGSEELALKALRAGAASYVPKRCLHDNLAPVLEQVLAAARVDQQRQQVLGSLRRRESEFALANNPALVRPLIALLKEELAGVQLCDETGLIRCGLTLEEAILNAIYHGNLEVSSELREQGSAFEDLARQRAHQSPYQERRVTIRAVLQAHEATFVIRDEGAGFDVASLPDPTDPANLEKPSGRGLLLIRTFMDEVRHNPSGNEITLVKRRDAKSRTTKVHLKDAVSPSGLAAVQSSVGEK
jgi:CheY-like chemotaxis protein